MLTLVRIGLCGNQYLLRHISFFGLYLFTFGNLALQNVCQISMTDPNASKLVLFSPNLYVALAAGKRKIEELPLNDSFMAFNSFQNKHIYSNKKKNHISLIYRILAADLPKKIKIMHVEEYCGLDSIFEDRTWEDHECKLA